jgi:hypothetical protein
MSKYLSKPMHQQMYAQAYAKHVEAADRALAHARLEHMFPSTEKIEGGRGPVSPLDGRVKDGE